MRKTKFILTIFIIFLIIMSLFSIYPLKVLAVSQKIDTNINKIDDKKYPGIKSMIQSLQKQHPNWKFKVLYTGLNWNDVIEAEAKHGRNLIGKNQKNYTGDWVCKTCGNKGYSGSNWICTSAEAIKYMMDPRNSIYYADIFQFLELSYDDKVNYKSDVIKNILKNTFLDDGKLDNYIKTIMTESKNKNVNPYYIATKIIQEQGRKGGATFKMKESEDSKEYYYNIFNINAGGTTVAKIVSNALSWAKDKGWNTIDKCLIGGISFISNGYISVGQDTMYFEKFDVIADRFYTHQYAQDVLYAQKQGTEVRIILESINATEYAYTFVIPLYEGMPSKVCSRPSTVSTNNNTSNDKTNDNSESNNQTNKNETNTISSNNSSNVTEKNNLLKNAYTGDIDNNNKIDAMDIYKIIQYILGKLKFDNTQTKAADLNKDEKIDAMDMYLVIQKIKSN